MRFAAILGLHDSGGLQGLFGCPISKRSDQGALWGCFVAFLKEVGECLGRKRVFAGIDRVDQHDDQ